MMKFECLHQLWHWLMDNLADGLVLSHPLRQMNGLFQPRERMAIIIHQTTATLLDTQSRDRQDATKVAYSDSLLITISYCLLLLR